MSPSSYTREEAVAQYIGQFLSEYLLQRAQTKDQQEYWGHLAAFHLMVSQCWQARLKGNDPFIEAIASQTMNQWYYDAIWSRVELLQSLWKLIESGYPSIFETVINAGHNYPFIGATDLFCHIVETHANDTFRICLKPYHNISNPARLKAWKILRKAAVTGTISPQNCNFIKNLASQYNGNSRLLLSLAVICDVAALGNREILEKLANLFEAAQQDMEVSVNGLSRKRSSRNFEKFFSFTWHHGKIIPANKTGGTYSL
jgi:hypothetical protein